MRGFALESMSTTVVALAWQRHCRGRRTASSSGGTRRSWRRHLMCAAPSTHDDAIPRCYLRLTLGGAPTRWSCRC